MLAKRTKNENKKMFFFPSLSTIKIDDSLERCNDKNIIKLNFFFIESRKRKIYIIHIFFSLLSISCLVIILFEKKTRKQQKQENLFYCATPTCAARITRSCRR